MIATVLTLAGVEFADFEIPEEIGLGGPLMFKTHRRQGGARTVDAIGADWAPISWSGRFRGVDGMDRARAMERMKNAGQAVSLTFGELAYTVLIVDFSWKFRGNNEHPYTITLEVITDDATPNTSGQDISATEMVTGDNLDASAALGGLSSLIQNPLSGPLSALQGAVGKVQDFASATRATISTVLAPLAVAQSQVTALIGDTESVLNSVGAVGGITAGLRGADLAANLLTQVSAMSDNANLYEADALYGRMSKNLQAIGSSGSHVIVAGYDLFQMAKTAYGDATEWSTIAQANNLSDPIGTGISEIVIPPLASGNGGVLI